MRFKAKTSYATGFNCTFIDEGVNANKSQSHVAAVVLKERVKHLLLAWLSVYLEFLPQLPHHFLVGSPPPPHPSSQLSGRAAPTALSYGGMISSPFPGSPLSSWNSGRFTFWVYLHDSVVIVNAEAKRRDLIRLHYIYLEYYWSHRSVLGSIFITRRASRHSALIKRRRVQTWRSTVSCLAQRGGRHPFGQQLPVKEPDLYLKQTLRWIWWAAKLLKRLICDFSTSYVTPWFTFSPN